MKHPLALAHRLFGRRFLLPAILLGTLGAAASSFAQTNLYWDADGATTTATGGTGTWDTTSLLWRNGSATGTLQTYTNTGSATAAYFGGTAGTVTIAAGLTINANSINFLVSNYTIAGASGATLNLDGVTPTVATGSFSSTISADITGSAGFNKTGAGTLTLSGNNTYSGGFKWIDPNSYVLNAGSNTIFGTSAVNMASTSGSATIRSTDSTARVFNNDFAFTNTVIFGATTGNTGALTLGNVTGGFNTTINVPTTWASYAATAALNKSGAATLLVSGNFGVTGSSRFIIGTGIVAVGGTYNTASVTAEIGSNGAVGLLGRNGSMNGNLGGSGGFKFSSATSSGGFFAYGNDPTFGATANNLSVNGGVSGVGGTTLIYQGGPTTGTSNFITTGQTLYLGNAMSNGTVTFVNGLNFNAASQTIQVDKGTTNTANAPDAILPGVLSNGGLNKTGTGILSLTGANTYAGGTTISAGTLLANYNVVSTIASSTGTGTVTVSNAGTILGGNGRIIGATTVNAGAILQGGSAAATTGTLTLTNSLTLANTSVIQLYLNSGLTNSSIGLAGATTSFANNQSFTFLLNGATPGTYQDIITGLAADPGVAGWTYTNGGGFTATFSFDGANVDLNVTAVPEPSTVAAGILTLAILGYRQRRQIKVCLTACRRIGFRG